MLLTVHAVQIRVKNFLKACTTQEGTNFRTGEIGFLGSAPTMRDFTEFTAALLPVELLRVAWYVQVLLLAPHYAPMSPLQPAKQQIFCRKRVVPVPRKLCMMPLSCATQRTACMYGVPIARLTAWPCGPVAPGFLRT